MRQSLYSGDEEKNWSYQEKQYQVLIIDCEVKELMIRRISFCDEVCCLTRYALDLLPHDGIIVIVGTDLLKYKSLVDYVCTQRSARVV